MTKETNTPVEEPKLHWYIVVIAVYPSPGHPAQYVNKMCSLDIPVMNAAALRACLDSVVADFPNINIGQCVVINACYLGYATSSVFFNGSVEVMGNDKGNTDGQ